MNKFVKIISLILAISVILGTVCFAADGGILVDGTTFFEAEDADLIVNPMMKQSDSEASGGKCIVVAPGSSTMRTPQRELAYLTYNITVPEDDAYFVWARVRTPSDSAYYANFDDGVYRKVKSAAAATEEENLNTWTWCFVDKYYLYNGKHEFKIRYRSANLQFDCFYITSDYNFTPEGASPSIVPPDKIYERDSQGNITNLYYNLPSYLPPDEHPRLMFRSKDIERIRSNLTNPQNINEYNSLLECAAYETDGKQPEIKYGQAHNINTNIALSIESNAFLYQITGDSSYGRKAVYAAKNFIESAMIDQANASSTGRSGMHAVWTTALCYDWCYDLLTDEDKEHLIYYMLLQSSYSEPGYPCIGYGVDTGHSEVNGHILEFQMLCGQFAASVAIYDEAPDVYNVVAGRILQYVVPAVNTFNKSSMYTEGSSYGMYRHYFEVVNNYIFRAMGYENVYDEEGLSTVGYFYLRQPDGEKMIVGDDGNYYKNGFVNIKPETYFYLGNMYNNSYFKTEYYRTDLMQVKSKKEIAGLTPAIWLIVNDVDVPCDRSFRSFPLTTFSGENSGYMFARTSWDEGFNSNAAVCLMNLKPIYIYGHEHKDTGHFSLYYKGLLALDSGIYQGKSFVNSKGETVTSVGYNNTHHLAYTRQAIAHNSVLVYDPNERTDLSGYKDIDINYNDGGQKMNSTGWSAYLPSDIISEKTNIGKILSYNWGPDLNTPEYSYMKGDITGAYSDKVEKFQRSFMFFNFNDETYPAALIVFDAVRSSSPTFKKTWLLHSEEEPNIDGNSVTITRDTVDYNGRLINQTLLPDNGFNIEKIGGEGYEFYVNGTNYEMKPSSDTAEVGNWRVEISPSKAEKQSYFLNVMQVSDNSDEIAPLEAKLVENTDTYAGVEIKDHVAYFRKDGLSKATSFTINPGESDRERFFAVTGLAEGEWTVTDEDGNVVASEYAYEGHDSISFTAKGSKFNFRYKYVSGLAEPDYSVFGLADDKDKDIDVSIDGYYETFKNKWYKYEGTVFAPIAETMDKLDIKDYQEDFFTVDLSEFYNYKFTYGEDGVTRFNGVLYAPVGLIESVLRCKITYDDVSSIASVSYGLRDRDKIQIYQYDDPSIAQIIYAYTEGETTSGAIKSIDGNTTTYSCTIGDGGNFIAMLDQETEISKVGLFWISGAARQEIFDMYVSADGNEWKQVFSGMSDGKTDGFEYISVGDGEKYRYVKLECHGNTLNSYNSLAEIIVYK